MDIIAVNSQLQSDGAAVIAGRQCFQIQQALEGAGLFVGKLRHAEQLAVGTALTAGGLLNDITVLVVDGDIKITPSYSNGIDICYGTGSQIDILNGEDVAMSETLIVLGNINGDAVVDVLDASEIEKASNDNSILEGHYETAADINSSGKIDILDYQAAVNKALS